MNDCSILICSCDKYEDAWHPFFTLFKRNWSDCPYPIYLNTETKSYEDTTGLNVKTLNSNPKYSWSKRLKNCLKLIDSKMVLLFLEDFFLLSKVKQDIVNDCVEWMKSEEIASICFERYGSLQDGRKLEHGFFVQRKKGARYTFSLQTGLWRKDLLIKSLTNFESPWEFEEIGNLRSCKFKEKFYVQEKNTEQIFEYNVDRISGYGLYRGKWLKSNVGLFSKYNIVCNFENLGFFENETQFVQNRRKFKEKVYFYLRHPIEVFKIFYSLIELLYKKFYWGIERMRYKNKVEK